MKKCIILVALLLTLPLKVNAEESPAQKVITGIEYNNLQDQEVASNSDCEKECEPHQTMKNLVEGRVANVSCLQSCKQRKVWEKLAAAVADVADSLKKNSCKEVLVPIEMKIDELKTKVDSIEKKLDTLKPPAKETPLSR
jgi:hypothetical protein